MYMHHDREQGWLQPIIERVLKVKALILLDMHIIALIDGCWSTCGYGGYTLALGQSYLSACLRTRLD